MKKAMVFTVVLTLVLSLTATAEDVKSTKFVDFNVLWDRASGGPDWDPDSGHFSGMGAELLAMGAFIRDLKPGKFYRDEMLENIDLVIICTRSIALGPIEQEALVRYVRNGGSLLVINKYYEPITMLYPVLINFGIEMKITPFSADHLNVFSHPATTDRRPVSMCKVQDPHEIICSNRARKIAGYTPSASPAAIERCVVALGGRSGRGRIIAVGNSTMWLSRYGFCGYPLWGEEDNTDLFRNTIEYLLGATDLQLKKFVAKSTLPTGKSKAYKARIKNLEYCYNSESVVAICLSKDKEYQAGKDTELGRMTIPEIKGKRSKLLKETFEVPADNNPGDFYVLAIINPDTDPLEINTDNNLKYKKVTVK